MQNVKSRYIVILILLFLLIITGIKYLYSIWPHKLFSPEVDAAIVNGIFTFITVTATLGITAYFNHRTHKIALQSQRSTIRDIIIQKRMDLYPKIYLCCESIARFIYKLHYRHELKIEDYQQYIENVDFLRRILSVNEFYLNEKFANLIQEFLDQVDLENRLTYAAHILYAIPGIDQNRYESINTLTRAIQMIINNECRVHEAEKDVESIKERIYVYKLENGMILSTNENVDNEPVIAWDRSGRPLQHKRVY